MIFPSHYLSIKPIFDVSLFGVDNAENNFSKNDTIEFSKEFLTYQTGFLSIDAPEENDILLQTCFHYLPSLDKQARADIVKVLLENTVIVEALMIMTRLDLGLLDDEGQYAVNFDRELSDYVENKKITPSLYLFLQKHFLNFERIEPAKYQNFELTRSEYYDLLSDCMKVQSNVFK
jgi:hypothetical protein